MSAVYFSILRQKKKGIYDNVLLFGRFWREEKLFSFLFSTKKSCHNILKWSWLIFVSLLNISDGCSAWSINRIFSWEFTMCGFMDFFNFPLSCDVCAIRSTKKIVAQRLTRRSEGEIVFYELCRSIKSIQFETHDKNMHKSFDFDRTYEKNIKNFIDNRQFERKERRKRKKQLARWKSRNTEKKRFCNNSAKHFSICET